MASHTWHSSSGKGFGNETTLTNGTAISGDVSGSVRRLILTAKHMQEKLRHWSIGKASEAEVSDAYVRFGTAFNETITAFKCHKIDLSDIYSVPGEIRIPLEQCLGNDPSPELLEQYMPEGKVRNVYATSSPDSILFVATDRISAYDVILKNGIPDKGKLLTQLSLFWFEQLGHIIPNHFITANVDEMPEEVQQYKDQLVGRSMLVKKASVVPLEAIVRGYLSGSAWKEYQKSGTVHGISLPAGLVESEQFPEPIFTPSTKAEQGAHDENISPEQAAKLIGEELYTQISTAALQLYKTAAEYARTRGVILADTKFEFGLVTSPSGEQSLILVDELLTPDSSRYWPLSSYTPGGPQPSFDKQYVRDWLVSEGFRTGLESGREGHEGEGWLIEESVVEGTRARYAEAVELLMK
ncbi:hypothetical protein H0H87_009139 [Tephrocybe sp. NHM501043]|nr:hypothetical protein H0H87_009139 [Tephrocybe sp. NHM501043]